MHGSLRCWRTFHNDHVHVPLDKVTREFGKALVVATGSAPMEDYISSLDIPCVL